MGVKKYIKNIYKCKYVFIMLAFFILFSGVVFADVNVPYRSYFYNYWGDVVLAPQAYVPSDTISGGQLGLGEFDSPKDIFVRNNKIYLLDTGNNRIVCLDDNWQVLNVIDEFENGEKKDSFNSPQGLFVTEDERIYVADTDNARLIELDQNGKFIREIGEPESEVGGIPDNLKYRPEKVIMAPTETIFVIAKNVYEGLLEFKYDGTFSGFVGAPRVSPSVSDIFWRKIATDEQRARKKLFLPIEYKNFDLDETGFIFALKKGNAGPGDSNAINRIGEGGQSPLLNRLLGAQAGSPPVMRLNLSGTDILQRQGTYPPVGDITYPAPQSGTAYSAFGSGVERGSSIFKDITSRKYGMYSILDEKRGHIFTYSQNGNLLYIFGAKGSQEGTFQSPEAIDSIDDDIIVIDSIKNLIYVFRTTKYAENIHNALNNYQTGQYIKATELWKEVLKLNTNYEMAYTGVGRSYYRAEEYQEAMHNFNLGNNRSDYSKAFEEYRRLVINENFELVVFLILFIPILIFLFIKLNLSDKIKGKILNSEGRIASVLSQVIDENKNTKTKSAKILGGLKYSLYLIFHPFDGYWDLKHEKKGNMISGSIIVFFVILTYIFIRQYTGFILNTRDLTKLNVFVEFISILVPLILFTVVNWAVTTLMDGKGNVKDIYIATCYALTPIILLDIPITVISNYMTMEEGTFYSFFITLGIIWSLCLLFLGTMVTHDYDISKTILSIIIIIVGMGFALFIILLSYELVDTVFNFFSDIYKEITLRL